MVYCLEVLLRADPDGGAPSLRQLVDDAAQRAVMTRARAPFRVSEVVDRYPESLDRELAAGQISLSEAKRSRAEAGRFADAFGGRMINEVAVHELRA